MTYKEVFDRLNVDYDTTNDIVKAKIVDYVNGIVEKIGMSSININGEETSFVDLSLNKFEESVIDGSVKCFVNNGKLEYIAYMCIPSGRGYIYNRLVID